jgi:aryl-alcohol dehydrogenase-like predicted oxidoreductase
MHYGRFNRDGVPSRETTSRMLTLAATLGLSCLDTAHLYGESEEVLGACGPTLGAFSIITKTPRFAEGSIREADAQALKDAFRQSLRSLGQTSVEALLIHHPPNLLAPGGERLYDALRELKSAGLVRKIGVSGYDGDTIETLAEKFALDIVQLPINLLDRRLSSSGTLKRLKSAGIEIHARSAFLQGLLLAEPFMLSKHFDAAKPVLSAFHRACEQSAVAPAHAALHYLLGISEIDKIIVGVESMQQFESIFVDFPAELDFDFAPFRVDQVDILNPVLWVN